MYPDISMFVQEKSRGVAGVILLTLLAIGQSSLFLASYIKNKGRDQIPLSNKPLSENTQGQVLGSRDLALVFNLEDVKKRIRDFLNIKPEPDQDIPQQPELDQERQDDQREGPDQGEDEDQEEETTPTPTPQPVELKGTTEIISDPGIIVKRINKTLTLRSVLGESIDSSEIEDGTITEPDLKISNPPIGGYLLSSDGGDGFTWVEQEEAELKKLVDLTDVSGLDYSAGYVLRADGAGYQSAKLSLSDINITAGDNLSLSGNTLNVDDNFVSDSGDTMSGELVIHNSASSSSTSEGALYYDTDDDNLYVYTSAGFVDLTSQGETYTAGTGINISEDNEISWTESGLSQEEVDDYIDQLLNDTESVHTLITLTYDDANDAMDLVVNDDLSLYDNSTSGFITDGNTNWDNSYGFITDDTSVDKNHLNNTGTLSFDWSDGEVSDDLAIDNGLLYAPQSGNVGIGTTSPDYDLDVAGNIQADNYYSGDGTQGASTTTDGLTFKDGLYTSGSVSGFDNYLSWVLNGDSGTPQSIGSGNTALFTGGTGIDTSVAATDELTLAFDATELSDLTWGSGSAFTWTMDVGATDPEIYVDSNVLGVTNANVGIGTTNPGAKLEIAGSGTSTISNTSGDIVLDPTGNDILPGSNDTDNLGSASTKWSNLWVVTSNVGDLAFANQFVITEAFKFDEEFTTKGLIFADDQGNELMRVDQGGNLTVQGDVKGANSQETVTKTDLATVLGVEDVYSGSVGIGQLQDQVEEIDVKLSELSQLIDNQQSSATVEMTEIYQSQEDLSGGEIVVVDDQPEASYGVKKSSQEFEKGLVGAVVESVDKGYRIGIAGRVKVKVVLPVGTSIEPGDYIATSQYQGVGQKAKKEGLILGTALEAFSVEDCDQEDSNCDWVDDDGEVKYPVKKINLLINPMWYNGRDDQLLPSGASTEVSAGDIDLEMIESLDLSGDLSVYGETFLADTTVSGNLNVGFTQIKDGEITVLGKERELKLQAMTGAGAVNAFDGKILLTPEGVVVAKQIKADKAEIKDLEVETGVTIKDKSTGEPYCVFVENGGIKTEEGACQAKSDQEPSPTETPEPTPTQEATDNNDVTPTVTPEDSQ